MTSKTRLLSTLFVSSLALGGCSSSAAPTPEKVAEGKAALGGACASVILSSDPVRGAVIGQDVDLTASAACASPEYLYWVKDPTGTWSNLCGSSYEASGECTWDTSSATPGSYEIQAWARSVGGGDVEGAAYIVNYQIASSGSCQPVALTIGPSGSGNVGDQVVLTALADCDVGNSDYEFWVHTPSAWTDPCGGYSPNGTCVWDTTGLPEGSYEIQAWAQTAGTSPAAGYTSVAINPSYNLGPRASCESVTATTDPPSGGVNERIRILGNASCSAGSPEYLFLVHTQAGWGEPCGDYSPSATCEWDTTGLPQGSNYEIQVWTRAQYTEPVAGYDSVAILANYALGPTPSCGSVSLSIDPSSTASVGTEVILTGNATCTSGGAEYTFYVHTPSGWIQPCGDFSANPSCDWVTAGLPAGSYEVQVWARADGTRPAAGYDSVAIQPGYQLIAPVGPTCGCPSGMKLCGSTCVSVDDPLFGCGAAACTPCALAHATATCDAGGACAIDACQPGWENCDGGAANGCEADLRSPSSCGSCGNSCGAQKCSQGSCVASCTPPFTDCNGECVNLASDADHCGSCSSPCTQSGEGRFVACSGGTCTASACRPGYTACDASPTGCVDLSSSPTQCGSCGAAACPTTTAGLSGCKAGACLPCEAGLTACNGACVDTTKDAENCGSCGHTCSDACSGSACVAETTFALFHGLVGPLGLHVDDSAIYVGDNGNAAVKRANKDGSNVVVLASGISDLEGVAIDENDVYFSDRLGAAIFAVPKAGGATRLVTGANTPRNLVVDGGYVYWIDNVNNIARAPTSGGAPTILATYPPASLNNNGALTLWGVGDEYVFASGIVFDIRSEGTLFRAPKSGGALSEQAGDCDGGLVASIRGTRAYIGCDSRFGNIIEAIDTSSDTVLWRRSTAPSFRAGCFAPVALFADSSTLLTSGSSCAGNSGPFEIVEFTDCSPPSVLPLASTNLATANPMFANLVADEASIYWTTADGVAKAPRP